MFRITRTKNGVITEVIETTDEHAANLTAEKWRPDVIVEQVGAHGDVVQLYPEPEHDEVVDAAEVDIEE